tara:strand:+ start:565 stop:1812 length:1248 start_codon:yes stop_codon:yes gene_type:complete
MALACTIKPLSAFLSTNLNNKIQTFDNLGDRIKRSLGYPLVSLEIHTDQLRENIQIAIEYFTKYAGYTREYLIFDSNMYEQDKGIRLDLLYTLSNTNLDTCARKIGGNNPKGPGPEWYGSSPSSIYVTTSTLSSSVFQYGIANPTSPTLSASLSSCFTDNLDKFELLDASLYTAITSLSSHTGAFGGNAAIHGVGHHNFGQVLSAYFAKSYRQTFTLEGSATDSIFFQNVFDYDVMDYRKVVEVTDFEEGSTTGINTLFTLEQTLAQQTYFSYALGNYGFDLVSWYTLKEWIDTREKMLAIRRDVKFDPRTQYMQMYPQPGSERFYGVISCYLERPIRDVIKEQWVYEYALALTMIVIGRVRGKFGDVALLGGGSLNYSDMLNEGLERKKELEAKLMEGPSPGFGDADPSMFFVG